MHFVEHSTAYQVSIKLCLLFWEDDFRLIHLQASSLCIRPCNFCYQFYLIKWYCVHLPTYCGQKTTTSVDFLSYRKSSISQAKNRLLDLSSSINKKNMKYPIDYITAYDKCMILYSLGAGSHIWYADTRVTCKIEWTVNSYPTLRSRESQHEGGGLKSAFNEVRSERHLGSFHKKCLAYVMKSESLGRLF